MKTISCVSLSGGQGKTTVSLLLGRRLALFGKRVLLVDADPQSSLTFYVGHDVGETEPTLLEVIKGEVSAENGLYQVAPSICLIPSDDALDKAQEFLSGSGMGAVLLRKRLSAIATEFDWCIIDAPPQRSQICLTAIGAADILIVPVEASSKGVTSLIRTLALIDDLKAIDAFTGTILGIIPFRDKWMGNNQVTQSRKSIESMRSIAPHLPVLPSIVESEQFKKAIDEGISLSDRGFPNLEHTFNVVTEMIDKL